MRGSTASGVPGDAAEPASLRAPIRLLPPDLIDKIAAGEVVERPASVVKELVENALDAGATHITVEVEGGGKRLIRVLDNGVGMTGAEARLALQRHATSKLSGIDDLFCLSTMGFRGEALPSIAAVSRLTLVTRTRDELAGTRLVVEGGRVVDCGGVGAPVGTCLEVCDLLANVPARLKFLKGDATEASHITDVVNKLAMAHPAVHLHLRHGGRTSIEAPRHRDGLERARALLGSRLGRALHPVTGTEGGVRVTAYLAAPELAQSTSRAVQLYVGRRAVRDRGLLHALNMGYGELVPKGRYPVAVVFVDVPDGSVDVNVHPQKMEVRFSDAQLVYAAVRHTVRRGVGAAPWLKDDPGASPVRMHAIAAASPPARGTGASELAAGYAADRTRMLLPFGRPPVQPPRELRREDRGRAVAFPLAAPAPASGLDSADVRDGRPPAEVRDGSGRPAPPTATGTPADAREADDRPQADPEPTFLSGLRYLGQLDRTYLVCETAGEMVLLDQHAAHERVEFQRLRERHAEHAIAVQRLLFPRPVPLSAQQAAVATDAREALATVGFELSEGEGGWSITAVPAQLESSDPQVVLLELLDELADRGGSRAVEERLDLALATIACHSVVRAGDLLSAREAEALLASLDGVDFKAHCPHGRPVLLRISIAEIARRLGR